MAEQKAGDKTPAKQDVKYTGTSDVREITKAQWAKAGVEDQNLVRWNAENGHTVKAEEITSDKAREILAKDPSFTFVDPA